MRVAVLAAESWDRAQQAREEIDRAGAYYTDRLGEPRAHPAVGVERDSQIRFARLVRELNLEDAAPEPRPPRIR
jgi:hypothetical protein